jgi:hypothetical protein
MTEGVYDIAVIGGGSAGSAAAVAAARTGKRVLLVERYGFLGGTGAAVLDSFYGFFTPGDSPARVVGGIPWEVVRALEAEDAMVLRPSSYGAGTAVTYNPEVLKVVWDRLVATSGADLLLHTLCTALQPAENGWRLTLQTRTDTREVTARWLIDASGDGQIATWSGATSEPVDVTRLQSMTTIFRVVNVNDDAARAVTHHALEAAMHRAASNGYDLPRLDGSIHFTPTPGAYVANMTRVTGMNPLDAADLTRAEVEGRRQALEYVRFLRADVQGYENARLDWLSTQIGIRESRRIDGAYTLTRDDVLAARDFPDAIARCGAPIEVHGQERGTRWEYLPQGRTVGIPLGSLIPRGIDRVLVAGRCLSASHDAHAAVRSMGQCMAMGQAAGTVAAQAIDEGRPATQIDILRLRGALRAAGAIVDETRTE